MKSHTFVPEEVAELIPPNRGVIHRLSSADLGMPLLRHGGIHLLESALWLPNHHHRYWELHYLHRGRMEVELPESGRRLEASGGWFTLTAPLQAHRASDGIMPPCHLVWMQLDLSRDTRGSPFTRNDMHRLGNLFSVRAGTAWPAPAAAADTFARLRELHEPGCPMELVAARIRAALAELLLMAAQAPVEAGSPNALDRIRAALEADPGHPPTVPAAARRAGISPAHLNELCARHLGITPAAWLLGRRLALARERLIAGRTIAQVAAELGFSSPRYFAHAFHREVGVPPSAYLRTRAAALRQTTLAW